MGPGRALLALDEAWWEARGWCVAWFTVFLASIGMVLAALWLEVIKASNKAHPTQAPQSYAAPKTAALVLAIVGGAAFATILARWVWAALRTFARWWRRKWRASVVSDEWIEFYLRGGDGRIR